MKFDDYITIEEFAERIGVSPSTAWNYCQRGRATAWIPSVRKGTMRFIHKKDAAKFVRPLRGNPRHREARRGK